VMPRRCAARRRTQRARAAALIIFRHLPPIRRFR
jgi:hypothetical protein